MESWKKNVEKLHAENGIFSVSDWNHKLLLWISAWRKEIDKEQLRVHCDRKIDCYNIRIYKSVHKPFIINLYFEVVDNQLALKLNYTRRFDIIKHIDNIFKPDTNSTELDDYDLVDEVIFNYQEPIFECDFVLNYLTILLGNYLKELGTFD
jgi:hypothetical protein